MARVKVFAAHMRRSAAKMQLGINYLTDTPNLDRVVEMSALNGALAAAFPDIQQPRDYPWPVAMSGRSSQLPWAQQHVLHQERAGPSVPDGRASNRQPVRPKTAPNHIKCEYPNHLAGGAAAIAGATFSHHEECEQQQQRRSSRPGTGGWSTRSPQISCRQLGVPDPAVLRQMKQLSSSHNNDGQMFSRSSKVAVHPCRLSTVRPQSAYAGSAANMQSKSSWQQQQRCNRQQPGEPTEPAGLLVQGLSVSQHEAGGQLHDPALMRPCSAPAGCRHRQGSSIRQSCSSGRSSHSNCLPARRAVMPSPAGLVMTQLLENHTRRLSGE